ncbi:hypothetical protein FOL47_010146 [Perkinsus chesapeaki]|uniref:RNase H type-1 domain-containing protein n=1 Tax=Perkinsus chesapeaki TaxID=330153 RepID=A0A7J6L487_PERCH|nr:hypothetical protein FOL47_010146 [Perkinsus chesapeaki]
MATKLVNLRVSPEVLAYADDTYVLIKSDKGLSDAGQGREVPESGNLGEAIENSPNFSKHMKILGITLSSNGNFTTHLKQRLLKARQMGNRLVYLAQRLYGLDAESRLMIVYKMLKPITSYRLHLCPMHFARAYRLRKSTPKAFLYTLSNRPPLSRSIIDEIITQHFHKVSVANLCSKRAVVNRSKWENEIISRRVSVSSQGETTRRDLSYGEVPPKVFIAHDKEEAAAFSLGRSGTWCIYTDGSRVPSNTTYNLEGSTGAAFLSVMSDYQEHYATYRLNPFNSIFQAELTAIDRALEYVLGRAAEFETPQIVTVFSDSQAGLKSLLSARRTTITVSLVP